MPNSQRIALVETDPSFRGALTQALEAEYFAIETFSNAELLLEALGFGTFNLIVMPLKAATPIGTFDGFQVMRLAQSKKHIPIIMTSKEYVEIDHAFSLKAGADHYQAHQRDNNGTLQNIAPEMLVKLMVERIKNVLRHYDDNALTTKFSRADAKNANGARVLVEEGPLRLDSETHSCTWNQDPIHLTVTEFKMLAALATRVGVVKSRNVLMDVAYGSDVYVDDRTVDSHIKRIRLKFKGVDDSFDMIETLYGVGYRWNPNPPAPASRPRQP